MKKSVMLLLLLMLAAIPVGCCYSANAAAYFLWLSATPLDDTQRTGVANAYYLHLSVMGACLVAWTIIFIVYFKAASVRDGTEKDEGAQQ